jgi:hypothetical protein
MQPVTQRPVTQSPPPWATVVLALLALGYAAALAAQAWTQGLSFDEPGHLAAGYAYWLGEDDLKPATTAPVSHIISGWAPLAFGIPLRRDTPREFYQDAYSIADQTFRPLSPQLARRLFFTARLPFLVFPLGILWLVWRWGRELFGWSVALILVAAAALEPNLLAHGPLINSDVAATFGMIWVAYAAWRFWNNPLPRPTLHLSAALALAILTKFSLLILVPFVAATILVRYALERHWWRAFASVSLAGALSYLALIAGYQFKAHGTRSLEFQRLYAEKQFRPQEVAFWMRLRLPMPLQFVDGLHFLYEQGLHHGQPGYMLGRPVNPPEPLYFPLALAIKYPIPLQALLVGSIGFLLVHLRKRQAGSAELFLWAPAAILFGLAVNSRMLPGIRYVLPIFPLLILAGGFVLQKYGERRWLRGLAAAGLLWLAFGTAAIYPHGLAYFNEWAGGPNQGWRYLSDSNIDWGQDLPQLAGYAKEHEGEKIRVAYFGEDYVDHYFLPSQVEFIPHPFCLDCVKEQVLTPEPGAYAISVNLLLGYYWPPEYRDYFRRFRERVPDAKAGYSIFIYRWEEAGTSKE